MHSALLLDEIVQHIFDAILDDGKSALCCSARCCRAWKDPALDRVWRRLPSAVPLLSLLPGFLMENDRIRFDPTAQDASYTAFRVYAPRVRHIVHCHHVLVDTRCIPTWLLYQLRNLESARIESRAAGELVLRMSLAPRLRVLTLQVGYTKPNSTSMTMHSMVSLLEGRSSLEHLSIRGHSSECFHVPFKRITTLRSLSLHLSSLTEDSFMIVSSFPLLVDFDVHANRLSHSYLSDAITRTVTFFPALERLKIRARPTLVALILQHLPRDRLSSLHLDATGPGAVLAFEGLFEAMANLPLHDFTLEHTIPLGESQDIPAYTPDNFFTLENLRPLSKLPLRRLILDSPLPPDLSDPAIEELARWWPLLDRLELGASAALENVEITWKHRNSLASLVALARGCKHLEQLVIALDVDSMSRLDSGQVLIGCHPLASLSIGSLSRPDVPALSAMLSGLFPSLVDVTPGFVGEHGDAWAAVQTTFSDRATGACDDRRLLTSTDIDRRPKA